jgi:hypothetical protein
MTLVGLNALNQADLMFGFYDVKTLMVSTEIETTAAMLLYAKLQCAWYVVGLMTLHCGPPVKDYYVQVLHHVCTIALIAVAFLSGYMTHVATLVMALHDISDIFLHTAKLFRHFNFGFITDLTFGVFALVFCVTRLLIYPQTILWSLYDRMPDDHGPDLSTHSAQLLIAGNSILILLHSYWFSLICRMIVMFVHKGHVPDDIRDESTHDA